MQAGRISSESRAPAFDAAALLDRIAAGHVRTISRCISRIENDEADAASIVKAVGRLAGKALVVGVTGVPGAGKSTLVPALARRLAARGHKPAILAVDPSSPLTGGAILGDRIRSTSDEDARLFFRSIASRGGSGGLSRTLDDVVTLLDAAGFDAVLIETVGTGQSDVAVTELAHTTLVVTAPGLGDEVQAMKAGILECADLVVVNKVDTDRKGAEATASTLRLALSMSQRARGLSEGANGASEQRGAAWLAPVRSVSALAGEGIDDLAELVAAHRAFLQACDGLDAWSRRRRLGRFRDALREALVARLEAEYAGDLAAVRDAVAGRGRDPIEAAEALARNTLAPRVARPSDHGGN